MQLASVDLRAVELIQLSIKQMFIFRQTDDLIGTQLGGALKNIIAIGYGIALEQGLGTNFYSMLVTAGMADLRNFGSGWRSGPRNSNGTWWPGETSLQLSAVTYSRNRKFGQLLGSGISVEKALQQVWDGC